MKDKIVKSVWYWQNGLERPLTANESRELAREWRARQGVTGVEEVNYTDQEYEDSSDCEGLPVEVPKVNRYRRRGPRRVTASSEEGSTDDTESLSDSSDSADEEIREIERRDNNPFNTMSIPKIIVEPNSPLVNRKDPPSKYIHQAVPLTGPTPPGTALYKPSLTSLSKYQYIKQFILLIMYCKGTALYKPSLTSLSKYQYIKQYILLIMYCKGTALYKLSLTSL
ncbi:uncharacterized protein LOC111696427 [Eurytemora carolleeae]|uniref:uncharacterized protein LOC111696427 n=1 Tax=Eurytemora carolleeae TaxID=1294199 RepID=UPI000C769E54|nr:uncharacterized protein LOC111696427 [Eurytemora carolleeae]|eukprot:XP_023321796.1 uncharacterized protein LOC111696427 [Eurytemora affinis]